MKFYIGVTDNNWFKFLSNLNPDEVNFWRPSGLGLNVIKLGDLFLFKLHSPLNFIVGGGTFIKSLKIPMSLAWDAFGQKNGAKDLREFKNLIELYKSNNEYDPQIGCVILNQPFFFPREMWIPIPSNWSSNIVSGKSYDTSEEIGLQVWRKVQDNLRENPASSSLVNEPVVGYGKEHLIRNRIGQGAFRVLVTNAYNKNCAISGEKTLPVLDAAHILPFAEHENNSVTNGLLLRADIHKLFDKGYLTITPDYKVEVSRKIKEEYENGKIYYPFHGKLLTLPQAIDDQPNPEYLLWHNENCFRG